MYIYIYGTNIIKAVVRIRIHWIRKILASLIRIQKYADPWIRIRGVKYQPQTAKKTFLLLKPKSELLKNFLISEWFIEF